MEYVCLSLFIIFLIVFLVLFWGMSAWIFISFFEDLILFVMGFLFSLFPFFFHMVLFRYSLLLFYLYVYLRQYFLPDHWLRIKPTPAFGKTEVALHWSWRRWSIRAPNPSYSDLHVFPESRVKESASCQIFKASGAACMTKYSFKSLNILAIWKFRSRSTTAVLVNRCCLRYNVQTCATLADSDARITS